MMQRCLLTLSFAIAFCPLGFAQTVRSWVSSSGIDTNNCSRTAPCRNFGPAVSAVDVGGEVVALDSGGYGPVTIDKAVSIIAPPGVHAAIAPTGGNAVTMNPGFGGAVSLRNLFLNSRGSNFGIRHNGGNDLLVEQCEINGFQYGIFLNPSSPVYFSASRCIIRNGFRAIDLQGSPSHALIERSRLENQSNTGIMVSVPARVLFRKTVIANTTVGCWLSPGWLDLIDSTIVRCSDTGVYAVAVGSDLVQMNLQHCVISGSGKALRAWGPGAVVRVSNSTITNNTNGVVPEFGSEIRSRGNNTLENNLNDNIFTTSYLPE